ncbi:uncharacterized protein [Castor canadensis]
MQYWPFATSDIYNWKLQTPKFSEKPQGLIDLLDSVLFTHQPTWDDCQQLLQILFTTEERERIQVEAHKLVPGDDGNPTTNQARIDEGFPLTRPNWDYDRAEGKERLWVYHQALMGGFRAAARQPINLAKVSDVQQDKAKSPAAFLEWVLEAYRTYTPMNLEAPEDKNAIILTFVNQSAPNLRRKLQKLDRLADRSLQELLAVAEKVYNHRETPEERQAQATLEAGAKQTRQLAKILLASTVELPGDRASQLHRLTADPGKRGPTVGHPKLQKNQCAYCSRKLGQWIKECPEKLPTKQDDGGGRTQVLELEELDD